MHSAPRGKRPKRLSKAATWAIIKQARAGSEIAFEQLLKLNAWLRESMARHAKRRYPRVDYDDCLQATNIGLWYAAKDFDPKRLVKFSTHATYRIKSQLNVLVNKVYRRVRENPVDHEKLDTLVPDNRNGQPIGMSDKLRQRYRKVLHYMDRMGPRKKSALQQRFGVEIPVANELFLLSGCGVDVTDRELRDAVLELKRAAKHGLIEG